MGLKEAVIDRARGIITTLRGNLDSDGSARPPVNPEAIAEKFAADRALFEQSGIYERLDELLAEWRFLAAVNHPAGIRMVPPIWTPRGFSPNPLSYYDDNASRFFALARWNRETTAGESGQEYASFWSDLYPVETWNQVAVYPDARKRIITVSALQDVKLSSDLWQDPVNLLMILRWCRDNPAFRGTPAQDYYHNYNSGLPHYSGVRVTQSFKQGGIFTPNMIG